MSVQFLSTIFELHKLFFVERYTYSRFPECSKSPRHINKRNKYLPRSNLPTLHSKRTLPLNPNPFQSPTTLFATTTPTLCIRRKKKVKKKVKKKGKKGAADPKETLNDHSSLLNCLYFHSSRTARCVSRCSHRHSYPNQS